MLATPTDFRNLIASRPAERAVQCFLEENLHLLADFGPSHKAKIIRQFPLGPDFRADFAFAHTNSGGTHLHLLEIESPRRRLFNQDDSFSAGFSRSVQQLQDWLHWCRSHQHELLHFLRPILHFLKSENALFSCHLIIGHRSEITNRRRQDRFESQQSPGNFGIRTYDGFSESIDRSTLWANSIHSRSPLYAYRRRQFVIVAPSSTSQHEADPLRC